MRQPDFWWRNTLGARMTGAALAPLGMLYGASVSWKHKRNRSYRARVPVICVGNLTVGGTGKTPVAIAIAKLLQARELSPVFLLRGYGGKTGAALVVEAESHDASLVGDEALLLARVAPTVASPDRAWGARIAEALEARVIIMDDGHQNFSVAKDLSLVVVDAEKGFGNGRIVPAGPLREPVQQGLRRTDAVLLMGEGDPDLHGFAGSVLRARLVGEARLDGRRVVAFAGIGRPEKFFVTLRGAGAELVETHARPDHHAYSTVEIARLKARARDQNALLITTEKDFVRLGSGESEGIEVLPVRVVFDDDASLERLLEPLLAGISAVK
jgi:tetraacyldisaccharide 4'-kinase